MDTDDGSDTRYKVWSRITHQRGRTEAVYTLENGRLTGIAITIGGVAKQKTIALSTLEELNTLITIATHIRKVVENIPEVTG